MKIGRWMQDVVDICANEVVKDKVFFKPNIRMRFQVAGVSKPLQAVRNIAEKGNRLISVQGIRLITSRIWVQQGSASMIPLRPNGRGFYLMVVVHLDDGSWRFGGTYGGQWRKGKRMPERMGITVYD